MSPHEVWSAVWPNLLANVLWVPLAWAHHRLMKRHVGSTINETISGEEKED